MRISQNLMRLQAILALTLALVQTVQALEYPYSPYNEGKMDPQLAGWPLTEAEKKFVMVPEYDRKPGHEVSQNLPAMWPVTPAAAFWGANTNSNSWLDHHATLVGKAESSKGTVDIALIGDSITQGWGGGWDGQPFNAAWQQQFGSFKCLNLGLGGDRTENVLWRLDHGAFGGVSPKLVVLLIGVNNAPLITACGVPVSAVAQGIKLCVENIRAKCPNAEVVVVKILPAFKPGEAVHADIKSVNSALDGLKLESDPKVHVLDLWTEFTHPDGSLKTAAYSDGHLHLGADGYAIYAGKLKPVVEKLLGGRH